MSIVNFIASLWQKYIWLCYCVGQLRYVCFAVYIVSKFEVHLAETLG